MADYDKEGSLCIGHGNASFPLSSDRLNSMVADFNRVTKSGRPVMAMPKEILLTPIRYLHWNAHRNLHHFGKWSATFYRRPVDTGPTLLWSTYAKVLGTGGRQETGAVAILLNSGAAMIDVRYRPVHSAVSDVSSVVMFQGRGIVLTHEMLSAISPAMGRVNPDTMECEDNYRCVEVAVLRKSTVDFEVRAGTGGAMGVLAPKRRSTRKITVVRRKKT